MNKKLLERLPPFSLHVLGAGLLLVAACYLGWSGFVRRPLRVRSWSFAPPTGRMALAQIAVSSTDLLLASGVLYALLPHEAGFTYAHFVGVYLLGIVAGVLSQVPGGLGVFETVVVLL